MPFSNGPGAVVPGTGVHSAHSLDSTASGTDSFASGNGATATGTGAQAFGSSTASNTNSFAEGQGTVSSHVGSHAEGRTTTASGRGAHAEGQSTVASGDYSHAEGSNTKATQNYAHAEGNQGTATGAGSHAEGYLTIAAGDYSHAEGLTAHTSVPGQHAQSSGYIAVAGDSQTSTITLGAVVVGTTTTVSREMFAGLGGTNPAIDSPGNGANNVLKLNPGTAWLFSVEGIARDISGNGANAVWRITGAIARDAGNVYTVGAATGAGGPAVFTGAGNAWTLTALPDATNNRLAITLTTAAGVTIHFTGKVSFTEVS